MVLKHIYIFLDFSAPILRWNCGSLFLIQTSGIIYATMLHFSESFSLSAIRNFKINLHLTPPLDYSCDMY